MSVDISARLIFAFCAAALLIVISQLIRHGHLKEKYALLWLPLGLAFGVFSLFPDLLVLAAARMHLHYITVVMLCVILGFTMILLYFTVRLSTLREDVKILAQELAMTRAVAKNKPPENDSASPESKDWIAGRAEKKV